MALQDEHSTLTAEESAYFKEAATEVSPKEAARVTRTQPKPKPKLESPATIEDAPQTGVEDQGTGEGTEDVGVEGQTAQQQRKMVDLAALQESRAEKKAADERARLAEERYNRLEQRTNLLLEQQIQRQQQQADAAAAPKAEVPDYNTDPAGYIAATMQETGRTLAEVQAELAQRRDAERQSAAVQHVLTHAANLERTFAAATPDYNEASNFLIQARAQELAILGFDPMTIQNTINQERIQIADLAMRGGGNPAEIVYKMAAQRGYKKAAAVPDNGQGGQAVVQQDPAEKIAALKAGQEASQSLSQGRGQAPRPLTAARLTEMSDADFDKMMKTPEGRALLGA